MRKQHQILLASQCLGFLFGVIFSGCFAEKLEIYLVLAEEHSLISGSKFRGNHKFDLNSKDGEIHAKKMIQYHEQLLESNLDRGSYNKLYSFKHVVNGFSIHTTPSQAKKLKTVPGIKLVEKDRGVKLMTTYTPQFLGLPQEVWTQQGGQSHAGEGIVIGFVDSGIDPSHPSFAYDLINPFASNISHFSGECQTGPHFPVNSCNGKIVSARYFSTGAEAAAALNSSVDILSPFDAVGHGSHVAATAAGNSGVPVVVNGFFYGQASGMAPRARIAVYKAVYPTVATLTDVIAAIDQAVKDGVDILTLSVGPDEPPEDKPTVLGFFDIAMLYARRAGVFVVQAAGNHGPDLSTVISYSPWVIGAATGTTDRAYPSSLLLGNGTKVAGIGLSGPTLGNGLFLHKLVMAKDAQKQNRTFPKTSMYVEECQYPEAFDPKLVAGSIVICSFSDGFYDQKSTIAAIVNTARTLRFMGFILVASPKYGDFIVEPLPFSVSGILIPKLSDSKIILSYYEENTKRGLVTKFGGRAAIGEGRVASCASHQAPVVHRFSSRGPNFIDTKKNLVDILKPDILAPGHQIWAAWSPLSVAEPMLKGYNFALLSGTSMATPHVAGVAALVKQYNPSWSPSMIASAISTTASNYDINGIRIMAESSYYGDLRRSTPFDLGAGHISPTRAVDPGLVLSAGFEDYISFLCSLPNITRLTINSTTGIWCRQSLSHPANLNHPSVTISSLSGSLTVRRSFRNVGTKKETYLCYVVPPNGTTVSLYPSWFSVQPNETQDLDIQFNVTKVWNKFSFGQIVLTGSLNHVVRLPLSVKTVSMF